MGPFDSLLKAMPPVQAGEPIAKTFNASRMNAIQECLRLLVRGENIAQGANVRKDTGSGYVLLSADPAGGRGGGGSADHPYKVTAVADPDTGNTVMKVSTGIIVNVIPTLYGTALNANPSPSYSPPIGVFIFYLRVNLDNTFLGPTDRRYWVKTAAIITNLDSEVSGEVTGIDNHLPELIVKWGDEASVVADREKGHFFVKIAEVTTTLVSSIIIADIKQFLANNYRTFAILRDDITLVA